MINKYLDHAREQKKLLNMKVTVISVTVGVHEIDFWKKKRTGELTLRERFVIIQITLINQLESHEKFLRTEETSYH